MILVGRYLSPFTRRTAIVLKTLNIDFEVKTLPATPANAELVAINPLGRVPAVVLDDGEVLIDSAAIIMYKYLFYAIEKLFIIFKKTLFELQAYFSQ